MENSFLYRFFSTVCIFIFITIIPSPALAAFSDPDNPFSSRSSKVVDDVDYIYLHVGLQVDYPLPEKFKKERLKFEGNYKRYTSAVYRKSSNDIRFHPKRKGSGIMIIKDKANKIIGRLHIDVQKGKNLHKIAAELKDLLVSIDGIEVKIYNGKIIIDGQVLLPSEMNRIGDVINKYGSQLVTSLVVFSPEAQVKIAKLLEEKIGLPEIKVSYLYNRFLIEGCVNPADKAADMEHIKKIASFYTRFDVSPVGGNYVPKKTGREDPVISYNIKDCVSVTVDDEKDKEDKEQIKKLIQIVVHFVEMDKKFEKGFLFQWAPQILDGEGEQRTQITAHTSTSPTAPSGIASTLTATVHNFFPKLQWAKGFNFARVLHNSSVLVEEKQTGELVINTAVPVPRAHGDNIVMESESNAGITTRFTKPEIRGERKNFVHMHVRVEVTSPEKQGSTKKWVDTTLHIKDGTSAVIGGVISSILKRGYGNPLLEGAILNISSSKTYSNTKSQFVIFITPIIKSFSNVDEVERIKRKFKLDES